MGTLALFFLLAAIQHSKIVLVPVHLQVMMLLKTVTSAFLDIMEVDVQGAPFLVPMMVFAMMVSPMMVCAVARLIGMI